ncbi:DVUA0089 family protein [Colwellia sp. D2M02]|uniref:DVUA0089 family protein n=1 Tax=Colwellia sp. D2M02 TaxID=2841562 RepID=UPI001C099C56|nr:DVUA0089 family protein [Colwellia sp. D2M02]MBU2893043.1 DVUA0089 family protein [Colwellia sp. D2M02]
MKKILLVALMFFMATQANATLMSAHSFTGNFDNDESRYYIQFDVTADNSTVDLTSLGYAGGVNADGTTIADGGFDSQLFVFNSASSLLASDDDSSSTVSAFGGNSWDAFISITLDIGTYFAVLTQYDSDYQSGDLVTGTWSNSGVVNFLDVDDNLRTSSYAFDISGENLANVGGIGHNTTPTPVSEPTTLAILALGLLGFAGRRFSK